MKFGFFMYVFLLADNSHKMPSLIFSEHTRTQKQGDHGPWLAHLIEKATADIQVLCNIFPILSLQLMKGLSFEQFFILKKKNVFFHLDR